MRLNSTRDSQNFYLFIVNNWRPSKTKIVLIIILFDQWQQSFLSYFTIFRVRLLNFELQFRWMKFISIYKLTLSHVTFFLLSTLLDIQSVYQYAHILKLKRFTSLKWVTSLQTALALRTFELNLQPFLYVTPYNRKREIDTLLLMHLFFLIRRHCCIFWAYYCFVFCFILKSILANSS